MAKLDIAGIAWNSWGLVRRHRFLWGLGLLAGGGALFSWPGGGPMDETGTSAVPGPSYGYDSLRSWVSGHPVETQALVAGAVVVALALLYVSYASRAGLILSVNYLEERGEKDVPTFGEAFHDGSRFFWRLLGVTLCVGLVIGALLLAVTLVIAPVWQSGEGLSAAFGPSLSLSVLFALTVLLIGVPWISLAERAAVLGNYGVFESVSRGWALAVANLGWTALSAVGFLAATLFLGLAIGLILFCLTLLAFGLGILVYGAAHVGPFSIGTWIVLGVGVLAACLAAGGTVGAFSSAYWTLAYRSLAYLATGQDEK